MRLKLLMKGGNIKVSVILPIYNEEKSVEKTVLSLKKIAKGVKEVHEIIAVNDRSTDKTPAILNKIKGIKVIHNPVNLGYGASIKKGMKASKGTHILITDSDGTYPIEKIPELVKKAYKYDMIVGSRTGKKVRIPLLRRPAKFMLNKLANFMSGKRIPDLNSGLRIFRKDLANEFLHLYPQKFSFTTTITLAFLTSGYSVGYIPINYYKRKGKSTIHPIKDFIRFFNTILKIVTYFNPFKIFFSISLVLFALAVLIYLYTLFIVGRIMDATVVAIFLAALQIFLFGLIADLLVKSRR